MVNKQMKSKKDNNNWIKNVEYIFTKEKLDELVEEKYIEKVGNDYIKYRCKQYKVKG
jgi:hypothetical protein